MNAIYGEIRMNKRALAFRTIIIILILLVILFFGILIAKGATDDAKEILTKFFDLFR